MRAAQCEICATCRYLPVASAPRLAIDAGFSDSSLPRGLDSAHEATMHTSLERFSKGQVTRPQSSAWAVLVS